MARRCRPPEHGERTFSLIGRAARDLARLITDRSRLPGAEDTTPLLAVTRSGCTAEGIRHLTPDELITAWA